MGDGNLSLTALSYRLYGNARYVRVKCVDVYGKTAWPNPIKFPVTIFSPLAVVNL